MIESIEFEHLALSIKDLEKSVEFYHHILGFKLLDRPDFDFRGAWIDLHNGLQLHLIESDNAQVMSGSRLFHFAFKVADVNTIEKICKENQIKYQPMKRRSDGVRQIFVEDPDGWYVEFNSL
ncbi:MAG TPA: VOC family protein [Saprospiraceae bacterium]|nr:VOC family protein [Saprospiraceae bacterium]